MPRFRVISALAPLAMLAASPTAALAQTASPAPAAQTPIAADRLEAARTTVAAVFPKGTYARMMDSMMGGTFQSMMNSMGDLPVRDILAAANVPSEQIDKLGEGTLKEMMAILDPAYEERMNLMMTTMTGQLKDLMSEFEPAFQDGLTRAYAKRFDARQLGELNRFFATPTGAAYANESMMLFMDPEVIGKMQELMPAMLERMPKLIEAMTTTTAHLPPPRKPGDLTPAERAKLEALLGTPWPQPVPAEAGS